MDRVKISPDARSRITDSVETALEEADGTLKVICRTRRRRGRDARRVDARATGDLADGEEDDGARRTESSSNSPRNLPAPTAVSILRNRDALVLVQRPHGACPECEGLGKAKEVDPDLVVTDPSKPLKHVFEPWSYNRTYYRRQLDNVAEHFGVTLDAVRGARRVRPAAVPLRDRQQGPLRVADQERDPREDERFEGVIRNLERRHVETDSDRAREHIEEFMASTTCPAWKARGSKRSPGTSASAAPRSPRSTA